MDKVVLRVQGPEQPPERVVEQELVVWGKHKCLKQQRQL
jgi:hypothetical protein